MYFDFRKLKLLRRRIYGLRVFVPWLRERHRLEAMVGPLGYWDKLQSYQLHLLQSNGLMPSHKLLDIGCGPLQGGLAFIRYLGRGNYYGIDRSVEAISAGKKQIEKNNLVQKQPYLTFTETLGMKEITEVKFDFMWASQILYYFDESLLRLLMKMISTSLKNEGKFLGDIIGPKHYEFRLKEHNWFLHTPESLSKIAASFGLQVKELGEIGKYGYPKRLGLHTNLLIEITKGLNV